VTPVLSAVVAEWCPSYAPWNWCWHALKTARRTFGDS
jgi:hypothetical protein